MCSKGVAAPLRLKCVPATQALGGLPPNPRDISGKKKRHGCMNDPFLIGEAMTGGYGRGGPDILHDCTIAVNRGEIAVIVGPNGAGKSTAMKAVFGMLDLREGQVRLDGQDITALAPHAGQAYQRPPS